MTLYRFAPPDRTDRASSSKPHLLWAKRRNDGKTNRVAGYPLGAVHLLSIQPDLIVRQSVLRFPPVFEGVGFRVQGFRFMVWG